MFTRETLAAKLETDVPTVLAFLRDGHLPPPVVIGGRLVRWTDWQIDAWTADGCPAGEPMDERTFRIIRLLILEEISAADIVKNEIEEELADRAAKRKNIHSDSAFGGIH